MSFTNVKKRLDPHQKVQYIGGYMIITGNWITVPFLYNVLNTVNQLKVKFQKNVTNFLNYLDMKKCTLRSLLQIILHLKITLYNVINIFHQYFQDQVVTLALEDKGWD